MSEVANASEVGVASPAGHFTEESVTVPAPRSMAVTMPTCPSSDALPLRVRASAAMTATSPESTAPTLAPLIVGKPARRASINHTSALPQFDGIHDSCEATYAVHWPAGYPVLVLEAVAAPPSALSPRTSTAVMVAIARSMLIPIRLPEPAGGVGCGVPDRPRRFRSRRRSPGPGPPRRGNWAP